MRRIDYPEDMTTLRGEYEKIFPIVVQRQMQTKWEPLRDRLRHLDGDTPESRRLYPDHIINILLAEYEQLVDMFVNYYQLHKKPGFEESWHEDLKKLFHYSGENDTDIQAFQPAIAEFFMHHQKDLKVDVCYYCELSYINSYGFSETYSDIASFFMYANRHQIEMYVRKANGKKLDQKIYDRIMDLRKQGDISLGNIVRRFNDIFERWMKDDKKKSDEISGKLRNHFDLDHFLPKSECPLVGLSLMNFVPCCPICNEKLKRSDILGGENEDDWARVLKKVSPTSNLYNFGIFSKFKLDDHGYGWLRAQEHPEHYTLEFKSTDSDYQSEIIDEFHLEERYAYHKCEALRWHDLMNDYPDSRIKEMAEALKGYKTEEQLRNDIFQVGYYEKNVRCFDKLRRDMLKV